MQSNSSASLFLKGAVKGMRRFGRALTVLINTALLFIVYMAGIGMSAIISRLAKQDHITLCPEPLAKSYWEHLDLEHKTIDPLYRQF